MSASLQYAGARKPSLRQRLMRLAERATSPLLPADYLDLFDPLRRGADDPDPVATEGQPNVGNDRVDQNRV